MDKNFFTFGGQSSAEFGITIEGEPKISRPEVIYNRSSVPGRNGDLFRATGAQGMVDVSYQVYFGTGLDGTAVDEAVKIAEWLYSLEGYQVLSDSFEPKYFRRGVYVGETDIANLLGRFGRCKLTFRCMPERFLLSGEEQQSYESGAVLTNPTPFNAYPYFYIKGGNYPSMINMQGRKAITTDANVALIASAIETCGVTWSNYNSNGWYQNAGINGFAAKCLSYVNAGYSEEEIASAVSAAPMNLSTADAEKVADAVVKATGNSKVGIRSFNKPYIFVGLDVANNIFPNSVRSYTTVEGGCTVRLTDTAKSLAPNTSTGIGFNVNVDPSTTYTLGGTVSGYYANAALSNTVSFLMYNSSGKYLGNASKKANDDGSLTFKTASKCVNLIVLFCGNTSGVNTFGSLQLQEGEAANTYIQYGTTGGALTVNDNTITFADIKDYLRVDCETENVYRNNSQNKNNLATLSNPTQFPYLKPGENTIEYSGVITQVQIRPRWNTR